ncbi:hypothetical protein ACFPL7_22065 [Dongia soli]|uniref:DUF982 domain-containing protein n=1 Tax=Dongia soli TaxID=600628 RepID=A0ABU5E8T7_9PROT|nr:hypothetical protein [Dongia soli]MDY0882276.1 hypothetical protein [Dongia soli]
MGRLRKKPLVRKIPVPPDEQQARRLISEAASLIARAAGLRAAGDGDAADDCMAQAARNRSEAAYLRNRLKVQSPWPKLRQ